MKKNLIALAAFAAFAATATTGANAQDVYLGTGLPGLATIGVAVPMGANWGLRADISGGLNQSLSGNRDGVNMDATLKSQTVGAYADWFPFDNSGFRLVGGLTINDTKAQLNSTGSGTATINNKTVNMAGQYYNAELKFPQATPYLGIGYGHHKAEKGLGFYADLGVMIGKFDVNSSTSLVGAGLVTQADVDAQNAKMRDGVGSIGFLPVVSLGIVYRY